MTNSILLTRHNQEIAQWSPDPFPRERVGSGDETTVQRLSPKKGASDKNSRPAGHVVLLHRTRLAEDIVLVWSSKVNHLQTA